MAELRWILLGLGAVLIAAIWWWSARRSGGQAPGNAELRESTVVPPPSLSGADGWERDYRDPPAPLEPLSIRTGDFERVPVLDLPMLVEEPAMRAQEPAVRAQEPAVRSQEPVMRAGEPAVPAAGLSAEDLPATELARTPPEPRAAPAAAPVPAPKARQEPPVLQNPVAPAPPRAPSATSPSHGDRAAAEPASAGPSEQQRIITVRVCAVGDSRWSGNSLISALEGHGLAYGRYQVYHRKHVDGRSVFFVASLIEPGTFDPARMAEEEYRGVSMFAVLPGPLEPLQAVDAMLATARELARELTGTVQDAGGMPFSPQRVAALREDVARFQSVLNS